MGIKLSDPSIVCDVCGEPVLAPNGMVDRHPDGVHFSCGQRCAEVIRQRIEGDEYYWSYQPIAGFLNLLSDNTRVTDKDREDPWGMEVL
jgi:hypothetical protein